MKTVFIGGNHPRHLFYLHRLMKNHHFDGVVIQRRESFYTIPNYGDTADGRLAKWHFENRIMKEEHHFGAYYTALKQLNRWSLGTIGQDELNTGGVADYVAGIDPDVVLVFGCGMIRGELFDVLPEKTINLHLGLSPWYRGAATLFWPFYFMEPQMAGVTFHKIVSEPDAGDILHQCVPQLEWGDTIHDVACKAVKKATSDMKELLKFPDDWTFKPQKGTGKNYLGRDFQPHHLRVNYQMFGDRMVDSYLNGELGDRKPKLIESELVYG